MGEIISYNPMTGEELGRFRSDSPQDVLQTVAKARTASLEWETKSVRERASHLARLRRLLCDESADLAALVSKEIGKPLQESLAADILPCIKSLKWLERESSKTFASKRIGSNIEIQALPYGVIGVIGTWNYPLFLNLVSIAWAVAAGNSVVWKPSELATLTAIKLQELFERAELPVWMAKGDGETGAALCVAGIDKLAFTGGVKTGRAILAELAKTGTPSVMELSGNDVMIVAENANIKIAAGAAVWGRVSNCGQSCVAPQRVLVHASCYDPFLEECAKIIASLRQGVDFTVMRTPELARNAQRIVEESIALGAKLIRRAEVEKTCCQSVSPTLLADCHDGMPVFSKDFFGPVVAVKSFLNIEEAIATVNQNGGMPLAPFQFNQETGAALPLAPLSPGRGVGGEVPLAPRPLSSRRGVGGEVASGMALAASVWTENLEFGKKLASRLKVGLVSINEILLDAADPRIPFGGFGKSGFGKLRGALGLEEFVLRRAVSVRSTRGEKRHLFPYSEKTLPILKGMIDLEGADKLQEKAAALKALADAARKWSK